MVFVPTRASTDGRGIAQITASQACPFTEWNHAGAQLEEAVEVCGDCCSKGDLHKNLGLIYCRSGNLEKGERELRLAGSLKPDDPDVKKSLEILQELKRGKPQR